MLVGTPEHETTHNFHPRCMNLKNYAGGSIERTRVAKHALAQTLMEPLSHYQMKLVIVRSHDTILQNICHLGKSAKSIGGPSHLRCRDGNPKHREDVQLISKVLCAY